MLTYDEIVKYITENKIEKLTPYQGKNGVGVVYEVEIEDYGAKEPRLATFDNLTELSEFADKIACADRISTSQRNLVVSEPKFMLRGKILTTPIISAEKKKQRTLRATKNEYYLYTSRRGQILIVKVEKIQKEIAELEQIIQQYNKKGSLLFKNELTEKKSNPLPSSDEYNIESLPIDKGTISSLEFTKLKITYEKLRRQKQLLQDKLGLLAEFAQKGFLKKLRTSQKEINFALTELDKQADLTPKKTYYDLCSEERKIAEMIGIFKSSPAPNYPEYYLELLNFIKNYDSMSIDINVDILIENENSTLQNLLSNSYKERARMELESSVPSQEEKNTELLNKLKQQYDEHLTEEQKDALLIYNSQFFALIGEISNIDDFETTNNLEIFQKIEKSPIYKEIICSLHSHCMMIVNRGMYIDGDLDQNLARIMEKVLPGQTSNSFLKYLQLTPYNMTPQAPTYKTEEFTDLMCDLIGRLKQVIQTIQKIPQDAVVLPEDITVYRGIDSTYLRNPQKPAKGAFISTSMRPEIAMKFGSEQPALYKILLRKGTPVKILPQKVHSTLMNPHQRFVKDVDSSDSNGTKEILLCTDDMQELEIIESIEPITHYQFENGEFSETKSGFIITGEMEPKVKQQVKFDLDNRKDIS